MSPPRNATPRQALRGPLGQKPPSFENLPAQPVLSKQARGLGWQLFADAGSPILTPTIERRLAGVLVLEHHLRRCVGRRLGDPASGAFLATVYILEGSAWGYGPRGAHRLQAGDIATWHSSQDIAFEVDDMVRKVVFCFDVASLGPLALDPARCDDSMSRDSPLGALASSMLGSLWRSLDTMPQEYHAPAMAMAKEAVSRALRANSRLRERRSGVTLFDRVAAHIEQSFDDPELSPASLAHALGISVRYLHLLFTQRGYTAAAWIRERRLAYCRDALTNVDSGLSVSDVAFQAGFTDPSHFSRVFRHRFGVTPNQYRQKHSRRPDP
jgi:AraC family transcriptional regulator, positive regulator of tynA and feaB